MSIIKIKRVNNLYSELFSNNFPFSCVPLRRFPDSLLLGHLLDGLLAHPRRAFEACRPWRRLGPRRGRDNSCMCTGYFFCTGAGWRDSCLSIVSRGILRQARGWFL